MSNSSTSRVPAGLNSLKEPALLESPTEMAVLFAAGLALDEAFRRGGFHLG
jgi:hypothetical protein